MRFKRFVSGMLCFSLFASATWLYGEPIYATELDCIQTEPTIASTLASDIFGAQAESILEPTIGYEEIIPYSTQIQGTIPAEFAAAVSEADASAKQEDLETVSGQGITFRLFNYSNNINKTASGTAWRPISSYFTFRNSKMKNGTDPTAVDVPNPATNETYDQDGFTNRHATVERVLDNGYPVLDFTRNADGTAAADPGVAKEERTLQYLFSSGDHAVTAYSPSNTILQKSGSRYWYDSVDHAVDYDSEAGLFRVRGYQERNSETAKYGDAFGDFLPFTYTDGVVKGSAEGGTNYHIESEAVDYWFGMTMEVNFFQTKDGKLGNQDMVFRFSGDDDVWVFVDDVLVLDLGGTHGTVNGSINFATGEVLQYLSWNGANPSNAEQTGGSSTSFPTTIRACFDAADRMPNGGWSSNGHTFADFTEHTLTLFYLERGASVANCSLDFTLPTLPDESLTVTKDLSSDADAEVRDFIADSLQYRFRVMKADIDGNATREPFLTAGTTYTLLEDGTKIGTGTLDADHTFSLKAGQSAQFTKMLQKGNGATQYVVEEIMPDSLTGQYAGVEYLVSGDGGEIVTNKDPAELFTAFQTAVLSAGQTQTVTFRNRVDTSKLGTLKITKKAAPGTQIPSDLFFPIQVRVGDTLLPIGSRYQVGEELRIVEDAGVLLLQVDETAIVEYGILSGTVCHITELASSVDGYRAIYSGTVEPEGAVVCDEDGATGKFPLNGTIHITVENADYDFSLQIPIQKTVLDFQKEDQFTFLVEQLEKTENGWKQIGMLPEAVIEVTNAQSASYLITVGYRSHNEGVFYYRITEKTGEAGYLYDSAIYIVEVTVAAGTARITGISKNGANTDAINFVNRTVTELTVMKTITGGTGSVKFPFTVDVFLDGEPFDVPEPANSAEYTVNGNRISFQLGHGEQMKLPCIPIGAVVKVEEHDIEGFLVVTELGNGENQRISGAVRELQFSSEPQTIHYINQTGFRLPNTGGVGTALYTGGGAALSLSMGAALVYNRLRKERRKRNSPDA